MTTILNYLWNTLGNEECPTSNVAILGDFNAGIDTHFDANLQELCSNLNLVVSGCILMVASLECLPMSAMLTAQPHD